MGVSAQHIPFTSCLLFLFFFSAPRICPASPRVFLCFFFFLETILYYYNYPKTII
ncbi:hypothetical protein ASPTUDRAFT_46260 [Aspergillus tubingensis CBS 134.48]|uniref:Uncharacterized protein n=1 Tax=Aspergillus tubingensis (strain CBS 134.48) TaxID=767770 RepID=A0A1L9MVJ1_ASPTC|nr:hypothetical protein ASPTUDRAFT_46260 [Aspergillus tubingensis CBS 134.48]